MPIPLGVEARGVLVSFLLALVTASHCFDLKDHPMLQITLDPAQVTVRTYQLRFTESQNECTTLDVSKNPDTKVRKTAVDLAD